MALVYTMKCNASCRICCFDCTPNRQEKMTISQAKKYVDETLAHNSIRAVGFSGGEALLYLDEICNIAAYTRSKGISRISVSTNGFWATDEVKTREVLSKLHSSGINVLDLTADEYHQEFIPIDNIKNILAVSEDFRVGIHITTMVTEGSMRLVDILPNLGANTIGKSLIEHKVLPIGAAKQNNIPVIKNNLIIDETATCNTLDTFAIFPDGDVYPCCSQYCRNELLKLGNMDIDGIEMIKKKYNSNMVIRILRKHGFKWFLDRCPELGINYVTLCDMCNALINDKDKFNKAFGSHIEEEMKNIYEAYLKQQAEQQNSNTLTEGVV